MGGAKFWARSAQNIGSNGALLGKCDIFGQENELLNQFLHKNQGSNWGGGDRGLGHCTISENPKVGHCTKPLKPGFKAFLGPFKLKDFLAAPLAPQNVKNAHFWAEKWATEWNFRRLTRRKWATLRFLVTPPFGWSPPSIRSLVYTIIIGLFKNCLWKGY